MMSLRLGAIEKSGKVSGMANRSDVDGFRAALLDCFGLWSSWFDGDLNMLETNSAIPNLNKKLLLTPERAEIIKRHMECGSTPLILGAKLGVLWSVVMGETEGQRELCVLGPVFTQPVTPRMAEKLIESYHLSFTNKRGLIECMSVIPVISTMNFFQFTVLLHRYMTGETVSVSDFVYNMPQEQKWEYEDRQAHSPLINEHELLDRVQNGNLDYRGALTAAGTGSLGIRAGIDPIRQAKYSVVAFITLCARAAIEGGLSSDVAYTLSDTYTETVDACQSISEIAAVSHTMYEDYIRRVHRVKTAAGISRPIQACRDYIEAHVAGSVTVEELAERSGYTPYYLTKLFKAETGYSVKEYILRAKVREAKKLLVNTDLTVLEISERLGFSTQSYFSHQFERAEGLPPTKFRQKNQKVN